MSALEHPMLMCPPSKYLPPPAPSRVERSAARWSPLLLTMPWNPLAATWVSTSCIRQQGPRRREGSVLLRRWLR